MVDPRRTTVSFEAELHRALRLKAAATGESLSALVNRAVRDSLAEDCEDLDDLDARAQEPSRSFETFVRELRADGLV